MRAIRTLPVVIAAVLVLVLAACTGVPTHSKPMIVKTLPVGGGNTEPAATTPAPNLEPRSLVSQFLEANKLDAAEQTSPRAFLTAAARDNWSDSTVTVVANTPTVRLYNARLQTVTVFAQVVGTVDASGIYTPTLADSTTASQPFVYGLRFVDGQYRISSLRSGLLLSESDFLRYYTQRPVYYFDLAHRYLVPDARWTSLTDPTQLADFLLDGLATNPSSGITNIVSTDTLPTQTNARRISANVGSLTRVDIPGAGALGATARNRLAELVSATLADVVRSGRMAIIDGGKAVPIPAVHGTAFTADEFADRIAPATPPPFVYFLRHGEVYGQDDQKLPGKVNDNAFFLQSVAVSQDRQERTNAIAAVAGSGSAQKLLVGTQSAGLRYAGVHGTLTRPAFAPDRSEVWVGDGQRIYAVTVDNQNKTQHVSTVALPAGDAGGQIVALRLSPDGSRVALVVKSADNQQQLFVAAVIRGPGQIRLDSLQQITPDNVVITDVAWVEPLKLFAIGYPTTLERHIYSVGSDGSGFTAMGTGNLPNSPTSLTVAVRQPAWVTADGAVWEQEAANQWISPGPGTQTSGYNAVYLE